jgi:DNA-binding transcriptional regulator YhcF (GntR family)
MQISLSKQSDVPLHEQLAEQIVFLITTGRLRPAEQLPSVRALARRLKIHHNTVSKAYQDLVQRGWLKGLQGSRLLVGGQELSQQKITPSSLDELINQSIRQARELGCSLQELRVKVMERLFEEPPDHILVVEEEPELRQILQSEIRSRVSRGVETCTPEQLRRTPELAVGAQGVAPEYALSVAQSAAPQNRPFLPLVFSGADEHIALIGELKEPSIVGVASISKSLLKTARSLLAPVLGQQHTFRECLLPAGTQADLSGIDVAFCDSLAMPLVRCRRKIHYQLIAPQCLEDIATSLQTATRIDPKLD